MARLTPARVVPDYNGAVVTPGAPNADGDILTPGDTLVVVNASGGSINVTVDVTATYETVPVSDIVGAVAAGVTAAFKVPPARLAAQASDAAVGPTKVLVNYSAQADVTRYVLAG
jgi:hypothetical protein